MGYTKSVEANPKGNKVSTKRSGKQINNQTEVEKSGGSLDPLKSVKVLLSRASWEE